MALRTQLYSRITLTSLTLLLGSTVALAGPHGRHGSHPGGLFARLDQNGDGKVEQAEARAAATKHFAEVDKNGDGSLTRDEQMAKHTQAPDGRRIAKHFARMDKNSDGKVERTETRMPPDAFTLTDTNKDGKLTKAELEASLEKRSAAQRTARFAEFDTNSDGKIARAEALAHADRRFAALDGNKDGHVTREEAQAAHANGRRGHHGPRHDCRDPAGKADDKSATKSEKGQAI